MVAPGAGFRGGTLYRRKIGEDQKKKGLRCNTSWLSVRKYVMTRRKRFLPTNQWVFGLKRKQKRNKMVTFGADRQPRNNLEITLAMPLFLTNLYSGIIFLVS